MIPAVGGVCVRAGLAPLMAGAGLIALAGAAPVSAATIRVPAGGDLQGALLAAQPGDLILLDPGAVYTGNFRLPPKDGAAFITVRTDAPAGMLPPPGVRIGPEHAHALAKIQSPNASAALTAADGAHHWRFELLEFGPNANGAGDIIALGTGSQAEAQMPRNLVFDRVYVHGDPAAGQKRGIALNSASTEIINSYISDIKGVGFDTQAICGWNGSGPFRIENNYLEAAGENLMFGGADPSIPDLVPADITIRRNVLSKPLAWRQERWTVKNALELKNARRVLIEGNLIEHVWRSGQNGFAVLFTVRNQNGRAPWSVVEDVTFRYNIVRRAGGGINITGYDDNFPSQQTRRIHIAHNLLYDIDGAQSGGGGHALQVGNGPADIAIERNTIVQAGELLVLYGRRSNAPWPVEGLAFRENLARHNTYGVKGDGYGIGAASLAAYAAPYVFDRNVLAGGTASRYPEGNFFPSLAEFEASFVNPAVGDFRLAAGSPYRTAALDGGALGADVATVQAATAGLSPSAPQPAGIGRGEGRTAVCRPGRACASVGLPSRLSR